MKFNICPHCGDHLDFGERCDCQQREGVAEVGEDGEAFVGEKLTAPGRELPRNRDSAVRV